MENEYRAFILAGGQGTRLRPLTDDRPKCLVNVSGKTILEHQLAVYNKFGINDIHVIGGYKPDAFNAFDVNLHINHDYATTNMVYTLFSAIDKLDCGKDLIISYGDIVFESHVLKKLFENSAEIGLAIDLQWHKYWNARMDDPLLDVETLKVSMDSRVTEVGKKPKSIEDIQGQYIGLIKIRKDKVSEFIKSWLTIDKSKRYDGNDYKNMYMTTFLQYLIDNCWHIQASFINNGWLEFDSLEDMDMIDKGFWTPC